MAQSGSSQRRSRITERLLVVRDKRLRTASIRSWARVLGSLAWPIVALVGLAVIAAPLSHGAEAETSRDDAQKARTAVIQAAIEWRTHHLAQPRRGAPYLRGKVAVVYQRGRFEYDWPATENGWRDAPFNPDWLLTSAPSPYTCPRCLPAESGLPAKTLQELQTVIVVDCHTNLRGSYTVEGGHGSGRLVKAFAGTCQLKIIDTTLAAVVGTRSFTKEPADRVQIGGDLPMIVSYPIDEMTQYIWSLPRK
jgi:hypothetical protein